MNAASSEEIQEIRKDLTDRFGAVPKEAEELLKVVDLRLLAKKKGVTSMERIGDNVLIQFANRKALKIEVSGKKDIIGQIIGQVCS